MSPESRLPIALDNEDFQIDLLLDALVTEDATTVNTCARFQTSPHRFVSRHCAKRGLWMPQARNPKTGDGHLGNCVRLCSDPAGCERIVSVRVDFPMSHDRRSKASRGAFG